MGDRQGTVKWQCGYCELKKLKRQAKRDGLWITVQLSIDDCGWDVYVHPLDVIIPDHVRRGSDDEDLPEVKYWKTWLFSDYLRRGCFC